MSRWLCVVAVPLLLLLLIGGFAGYHLRASAPVVEVVSAALAERQHDGLVAERVPDPTPPPVPHQLAAGAKEERRVGVTIKPKQADGDPVHVDRSLVHIDGGRCVVVSSPEGEVTQAIDIPIIPALMQPAPTRWAVGTGYMTHSPSLRRVAGARHRPREAWH